MAAVTMTVDDIRPWNDHAVRSRFPALARNAPPIYADAPGGTQVPSEVIDAMVDYLSTINSNIEGEFDALPEIEFTNKISEINIRSLPS